jgi:hypothetical protein
VDVNAHDHSGRDGLGLQIEAKNILSFVEHCRKNIKDILSSTVLAGKAMSSTNGAVTVVFNSPVPSVEYSIAVSSSRPILFSWVSKTNRGFTGAVFNLDGTDATNAVVDWQVILQ